MTGYEGDIAYVEACSGSSAGGGTGGAFVRCVRSDCELIRALLDRTIPVRETLLYLTPRIHSTSTVLIISFNFFDRLLYHKCALLSYCRDTSTGSLRFSEYRSFVISILH